MIPPTLRPRLSWRGGVCLSKEAPISTSTFDPHQPVLITSDGKVTPIHPESGKHFGLKELQKAVGGYIQTYPMPKTKSREIKRIMIMNEEGRLHGLPKNVVASAAFGPEGDIVGDVVICPSRMLK